MTNKPPAWPQHLDFNPTTEPPPLPESKRSAAYGWQGTDGNWYQFAYTVFFVLPHPDGKQLMTETDYSIYDLDLALLGQQPHREKLYLWDGFEWWLCLNKLRVPVRSILYIRKAVAVVSDQTREAMKQRGLQS